MTQERPDSRGKLSKAPSHREPPVTAQLPSQWPRGGGGGGGGVRRGPLLPWEQGGELAEAAARRGRAGLLPFPVVVLLPTHRAVASQLVPRGTWRHLVSASTGAGPAEGCGRLSSASDARLQGVAGAFTPAGRDGAGSASLRWRSSARVLRTLRSHSHSLRGAAVLLSVEGVLPAAALPLGPAAWL